MIDDAVDAFIHLTRNAVVPILELQELLAAAEPRGVPRSAALRDAGQDA
jgi:hypothetical protein